MTSLDDLVQTHEVAIRIGFFFGVFLAVATWEGLAPRRPLAVGKLSRWAANLGLVALNTLLLRLLFPAAAIGMSLLAQNRGWGVFNYLDVPYWLAFAASMVALDLTLYLQHVMFHAVPLLWRLHRVHHADLDFDVTTGARFHPVEMVLSMCIKLGAVALLGAPPAATVLFEVVLNALAMFNHGNVRLGARFDHLLRLVVVTPDMHRVHHSTDAEEANSNFGFNLPWWDRFFQTYRPEPKQGHEGMEIGVRTFRDPTLCDGLLGMIQMPFLGKTGGYAINRPRA
jgi:sterol desaturase/sphingolipid hydroxylase (fatty acid hydroxylase superfamily)